MEDKKETKAIYHAQINISVPVGWFIYLNSQCLKRGRRKVERGERKVERGERR